MASTKVKLDCFRLITDMQYAGVTTKEVARLLGKPPSTVQNWKAGTRPRWEDAERLIELHEVITSKAPKVAST